MPETYLDAGAWLAARMTAKPRVRKVKLRQATNVPAPNLGTNLSGPASHGEGTRKALKAGLPFGGFSPLR